MNRILSLIGWLGTALVFGAVAIKYGYPAKEQYATYLAWAGLVCVLLYTLGQWREIAKLFGHRQAKYGSVAVTSILVVLAILVAINYIGAKQNKRWDLTANKQFSLSDQTRNVLAKLDAPLSVMIFYDPKEGVQAWQDRMKEYEYSSKKVSIDYIDPDKKPAIARQNQIEKYNTVVFAFKGRTERVTSNTEQDLTNAIIKVVSGAVKKIYFTVGHGEHDYTSTDRDGYKTVSDGLTRENYSVDKLVLAQTGSVPDDATAVVVAGPKADFFPQEIDALKKYLGKAGKVLLELDPPEKATSAPLTSLVALAHDWGTDVGNNIVVDASGMGRLIGTDASVPVVASYPPHPITQRFNLLTAYPLSRSAEPVAGGVEGHTAQTFLETGPSSWAESDIKGLLTTGKVTFDESSGDKKGPISIGTAVSAAAPDAPSPSPKPGDASDAPKPESRVVVIGDSDFASNATLAIPGNRDLFMNVVGWLAQQENLISIRPKDPEDRRLALTSAQTTNIVWLSLLFVPGFIFATGVYTWWQRR